MSYQQIVEFECLDREVQCGSPSPVVTWRSSSNKTKPRVASSRSDIQHLPTQKIFSHPSLARAGQPL